METVYLSSLSFTKREKNFLSESEGEGRLALLQTTVSDLKILSGPTIMDQSLGTLYEATTSPKTPSLFSLRSQKTTSQLSSWLS